MIVGDEAVRSCLMFAVQAQGKPIRTVEGLAKDGTLHPLQRAFMAHHGLQCGFCTPGFLMLTVNALEKNPRIGDEELLDVLSSNLCRCTGYQNIIKAVQAARDEMRPQTPRIDRRRRWRQPISTPVGRSRSSTATDHCPPIARRVSSTTSFGVA